jgi:hypothetical protein
MNNFRLLNNATKDKLYVVLMGLSGGKNESMTKDLSSGLTENGSVLNIQFCNDPGYQDVNLKEIEDLTFEYCFETLDREIEDAKDKHKRDFNEIVFVSQSFSALISIYYLYKKLQNKTDVIYKLALLDKSSSKDIVEYMKTDQKEIKLSKRLIEYLENNNEIEMLKALEEREIKIKNIEAEELGANHEFEGDGVRKVLTDTLKSF